MEASIIFVLQSFFQALSRAFAINTPILVLFLYFIFLEFLACIFFDIAVLRYSGDKKFDYLFFDKKRYENRYNVTAISPRLLYLNIPKKVAFAHPLPEKENIKK